jgi:hypothetical protein
MTHIIGTIHTLPSPKTIGPDSGLDATSPNIWTHDFEHTPAPEGTKFVILHFRNAILPASNRLEVDLGYDTDTDVFTSADGTEFWTRPVNIYVLPNGKVPIRYITDGSATGRVELDIYGRGERHVGTQDPTSKSNCDPFLNPSKADYTEPKYDPFWYCEDPPNWENIACITPAGDVRAEVARSVGMMVSKHTHDDGTPVLSSCSVTLVDADKVLTAGHCLNPPEDFLTASVTFDYQVNCGGDRPDPYNARFHKVKALLKHRWDYIQDYCLLQLTTAPPGIPPIQMRHDIPSLGEQVFGIHHPNGAPKKISIPHPDFITVSSSNTNGVNVPIPFHVSGGSSGSGLFDTAGRIVGVLSQGDPCKHYCPEDQNCPLSYYPTASILLAFTPTPPPAVTRDVMIVFDRSGSMSMDEGTGRAKIEAARDAVSLFVQLVRVGTGNRLGLVSFSNIAKTETDPGIAAVTYDLKEHLTGNAPFSSGLVGDLEPGGATSIGEGLDAARLQFPAQVVNPRAIILLTDGLQNTPRRVEDVDDDLTGITVHAIGYGTEAGLDGELLWELTTNLGGDYTRAGSGLALEKFFAQAFGNIFEAGILIDPEYNLPENQSSASPLTFRICGEEMIAIVVGWDRTDAKLFVEVSTPNGQIVSSGLPDVESITGRGWSFLRFNLPHGGERDGVWSVRVRRPSGGGEFPPPAPSLRYFISVVPKGGPRLSRLLDSHKHIYYTGDSLNPLVMLRYSNGSWPIRCKARTTISRPIQSIGNILSSTGLKAPVTIDLDTTPPRQSTLQQIEKETGQPVVQYTQNTFDLMNDPANTGGLFEPTGIFGRVLTDQLTVEGNYTFHAEAEYGSDCIGTRELAWSIYVAVGIDPTKTEVSTQPAGTLPDGTECTRLTFVPKDRYGNFLGPGRLGAFEVQPQPGSISTGDIQDLGNGSYQVDVCWDKESDDPPSIGLKQPERPLVVIGPGARRRRYIYSVKFLCGEQKDECCSFGPVRPGRYATDINIHNFQDREVTITKRAIPLVLAGGVRGREPKTSSATATDRIKLSPHSATMDDCHRILELFLGASPTEPIPLTLGILEITSSIELNVTAVYTVTDLNNGSPSIEVESIVGKLTQ